MSKRRTVRRRVGGFLRDLLLRNVWLKLLSLLFAVGFYAFIHSAENVQRTFMVDLTVYLPPASAKRQLMTQVPTRISVTLQGLAGQLSTLRGEDLGPIAMDLTEGTTRDFRFDESMLSLPPRVTVKRYVPASLPLEWEDIITRKIPVQVTRTGEPATGYEVQGEPEPDPAAVEVKGPESLLNVIQFVRAVDFDVTGLAAGEYARHLALDVPAELAQYDATFNVHSVLVTVRIGQQLETRTFSGLKVEVVGLPRATTVPPRVDVKVTGPPDRVTELRPEVLLPRVEVDTGDEELPATGSVYSEVLMDAGGLEIEVIPIRVLVKW